MYIKMAGTTTLMVQFSSLASKAMYRSYFHMKQFSIYKHLVFVTSPGLPQFMYFDFEYLYSFLSRFECLYNKNISQTRTKSTWNSLLHLSTSAIPLRGCSSGHWRGCYKAVERHQATTMRQRVSFSLDSTCIIKAQSENRQDTVLTQCNTCRR